MTEPPVRAGWMIRSYRWALARSTPEFRARYQDEMTAALARLLAEERAVRGRGGALLLWGRAMVDAAAVAERDRMGTLRRAGPLAGTWHDVRTILRSWKTARTFAAAGIATVTLGLGLNAAIFALADGILFRPLPFEDPDALYRLAARGTGVTGLPLAVDVLAIRQHAKAVTGVMSWGVSSRILGDLLIDGRRVSALEYDVSKDFSRTLGLRPAIGRPFQPDDHLPNAPLVMLLGDGFWRREFGADPGVIGRRLNVAESDGPRTVEVIGVLPASFRSLDVVNRAPDVLVPEPANEWTKPGQPEYPLVLDAIVRVSPDASIEQATQELNAIVAGVAADAPSTPQGRSVRLVSLRQTLTRSALPTARLVLAGALLVLLLVTTNLAHLLLARGSARAHEFGVRVALGASRWRVVRLLLTESVLVTGLGVLGGLLLGYWLSQFFEGMLPEMRHVYRIAPVSFDGRVIAYSTALALVVAVLAGLLPAWRASQLTRTTSFHGRSQSFGAGRMAAGRALLTGEIAVAFVIVVCGALVGTSLWRLLRQPLGFDAASAYIVQIRLPDARYPTDALRLDAGRRVVDELTRLPGVQHAAALAGHPTRTLEGTLERDGRMLSGFVRVKYVTGEYFDTLGIHLSAGRTFTRDESFGNADVAVVDRLVANALWPGQAAIGQLVHDAEGKDRVVVGVVAPIKTSLASTRVARMVYMPLRHQRVSLSFVVSGRSLSATVLDAAANRMALGIDPDAWAGAASMAPALLFDREVGEPALRAVVVGVFSVIALLLVGVGLYGLIGYTVERRFREFGVRLALGARVPDIWRLVVGQALVPMVAGVAGGAAIAIWVTELLRSSLFGVTPTEPGLFAAAALLIFVVGALAIIRPARRATRVDPVIVLRAE